MFDIKRLKNSFKYALAGFKQAFKEEQNLQIHVAISIAVLILAAVVGVRKWEAVALILLITAILILELINTIFEKFSDMLKPRVHTYVKIIKDMMAATVLVAAFGAIIIGILIFYPYLSGYLK